MRQSGTHGRLGGAPAPRKGAQLTRFHGPADNDRTLGKAGKSFPSRRPLLPRRAVPAGSLRTSLVAPRAPAGFYESAARKKSAPFGGTVIAADCAKPSRAGPSAQTIPPLPIG